MKNGGAETLRVELRTVGLMLGGGGVCVSDDDGVVVSLSSFDVFVACSAEVVAAGGVT